MITIRQETPADIPAIHAINRRAFGQDAEADLVAALRNGGQAVISLVAVDDEQVLGHFLFSPVNLEPHALRAVGLAPMAVLPEHQNRGIGSMLVEQGLDECRRADYECVVVLGHPEFYPRFGFTPASRFGIKSEYDVRDEVFMALELRAGALANRRGTAKYQPEFNAV